MPAIGDLFVKLGRGESLTTGEVETLRLEMNQIQYGAGVLSTVLDPRGGLDTNVFRKSGEFSELPIPVASLRFSAQEIATGTTYAAPTVDASSTATWYYGVTIDTANAKLQVHGQPGASVLLFTLWWRWDPNATNHRGLQWTDNSGNSVEDVRAGLATYNNYLHVSHVRRMAADDTWYQLKVWQNSGGNLSGDGLLTVARLR